MCVTCVNSFLHWNPGRVWIKWDASCTYLLFVQHTWNHVIGYLPQYVAQSNLCDKETSKWDQCDYYKHNIFRVGVWYTGVKYSPSPSVYSEYITRDVSGNWRCTGGRKVCRWPYICKCECIELKHIFGRLCFNARKTRVIRKYSASDWFFDVVSGLICLGSLITSKSIPCDNEIKRRLAIARSSIMKLTNV